MNAVDLIHPPTIASDNGREKLSHLPFHGLDRDALILNSKILVVDDESLNVRVACKHLANAGFTRCMGTTDSTEAIRLVKREMPDLILLDVLMPEVNGLDILSELRATDATRFLPVVIFSASTDVETRLDAFQRGANDFVAKPIEPSEFVLRVRNLIALKAYQDKIKAYSDQLELAVQMRTEQLELSRQDVVHCLARAAEYRDDETGHHVLRVGKYARIIGEALGLRGNKLTVLEHAAKLHDVGKIGIPDSILLKKGKLSNDEFSEMKRHCVIGQRILQRVSLRLDRWNNSSSLSEMGIENDEPLILDTAERIAISHHEWWNGAGYPLGIMGEAIPLEGRITAVADVFDALCTKRRYKDAFPLDKCLEIMLAERGTHFDPNVIDAFLTCIADIVAIQYQFDDQ